MAVVALLMLGLGAFTGPAAATGNTSINPTLGGLCLEGCELGFVTEGSVSAAASLTPLTPFWVDMVDVLGLDYDGEDIYIAVLDTGLINAWDQYFETDSIATEYAKGFSYDFTWDDTEKDFIRSDLKSDRGYVTKTIGSGHGTHVTSTIVGYRGYLPAGNFWVKGVAAHVKVIPVLVLDTWLLDCPDPSYKSDHWPAYGPFGGQVRFNTACTDEMVAAGIEYVTGLAEDELSESKVIISMSLGFSEEIPVVEDAIEDAIDAGVVVVASAGNKGYDGMSWPGAYPEVISCGAAGWTETWIPLAGTTNPQTFFRRDVPEDLNSEDAYGNDWHIMMMAFSSRPSKALGQKSSDLDVTTPGYAVMGPYQNEVRWYEGKWQPHSERYPLNTYFFLQGTSMSAPHVASIAAIVQQWAGDYDDGEGVDISQKHMEHILQNAARRNWPPGSYDEADWYSGTMTWNKRSDWGTGLLQGDEALVAAAEYVEDDF